MKIVPLSSIDVRGRQRRDIAAGPLSELADSIARVGLLHPPVCYPDGPKWVLSVGERRLRAFQHLFKTRPNASLWCGDQTIPSGSIAITELGDYLDEVGRFEAELDENIHRVDLEWQDRTRALNDLHQMRQRSNPSQTLHETGKELAAKGAAKTAESGARRIRNAQIISEHLHHPTIARARSAEEALGLIYKAQEERAVAALVKRQLLSSTVKPEIEIRHGDLLTVLPALEAQSYDLIIADPPYGIDAGGAGYRARTVHHHNYSDDPETAKGIARAILTEGFRITKTRANLLMFCDIDYFDWLKMTSANMGWVPFRRPLIWMKSESEGMAPWGAQGPRITTEFIFFATKGQRGLHASPVDVFNVRRVSRSERIHAGEKPVELLKQLISCSTLPGDSVLDPCCGSGSALVAAKELQRQGLGIEKDETYFTTALANVHGNSVTPDEVKV